VHKLPSLRNLYLVESPMHSPERIAEIVSQHKNDRDASFFVYSYAHLQQEGILASQRLRHQ
jgi:hypothetical protein